MKKIIGLSIVCSSLFVNFSFASEKKISELESRIEDLELSRDLNIFEFSGELENRYDVYQSVDKSNSVSTNNANKSFFASYFKMNMNAKPSDRLSFYGRLSMSKNWNEFAVREGTGLVSDSGSGGRDRAGTKMFIERAFINYKIINSLVFTIGRMPTVDGPPYHISKMNPRSGAYPLLAYASILDGMALTHGMNLGNGKLNSRIVFTPATFNDKTADTTDKDSVDSTGRKVSTSTPMVSAMLDYEGSSTKFWNKMNLIGQYLKIDDFYLDTVVQSCSPTCTGIKASNLFFNLKSYLLTAEFNGIAKTGFDFSLTYKHTITGSKGGLSGNGFFTSLDRDESTGSVWLLSTAYNFGSNSKFKVGYEYISISDKAFQIDNTENVIGFYSGPDSKGHHLYAGMRIDSTLKLILGFMSKNHKKQYTNGLLGPGTKINVDRTSGYARLIANF